MPKAYKALPPASELWEMFDYKPLTGELVRKSRPEHKGTVNNYGYIAVMHKQTFYVAHRLVWKWVKGAEPTEKIDHINHVGTENQIWNLREATHAQNMRNRKATKGYSKTKSGTYKAKITVDGNVILLGTYKKPEQAHSAYKKASLKYHGEFSRYSNE